MGNVYEKANKTILFNSTLLYKLGNRLNVPLTNERNNHMQSILSPAFVKKDACVCVYD